MNDIIKDIIMTKNVYVYIRGLYADSGLVVLAATKTDPLPCCPFQTVTFCHPNILCYVV
jgi:hypothetical protein